jgi:hypothetical protein
MKRLLLTTALLGALSAPAFAATTAAFHVGATSNGGAGTDPNLIPSALSFFIADNPNKAIASPLTIYFAVPDGEPIPVVNSVLYKGVTAEPITTQVAAFGPDYTAAANKDFYSFVGCTSCNNSLQFSNLSAGESHTQVGVNPNPPIAYDVYKMVVNVAFKGKDYVEFFGEFADGTYIVPWANGFDTSFTNVGLITSNAIINPTVGGVPEPSTWAMLGIGFAGLGFAGSRRSRKDRLAGST